MNYYWTSLGGSIQLFDIKVRALFFLLFSILSLSLSSCSKGEDLQTGCEATSHAGSESGLVYSLPNIKSGESQKKQANLVITNGARTFELTTYCSKTQLTFKEEFIGASCEVGFLYNSLGLICESETVINYLSSNIAPNGRLNYLDLDNALDSNATNTFTVKVNGAEDFASDVATEIADGKIMLSPNLDNSLSLLSGNYAFMALEGDQICFDLESETRSHCYIKNEPSKSSETEVLNGSHESDFYRDLLGSVGYTNLNFRGVLNKKNIVSLNERKKPIDTLYRELDHSGLFFDADFSLEQNNFYRLEIEANGGVNGSSVEIILYRKSDFDIANLQDGYLKKFKINFSDSSLRRKKERFDFGVSTFEQAEELTVLIYGERQAYVRNFKISKIEISEPKNLSVFLSGTPSRSIGTSNYVPDQYVPFGMSKAYGYGSFKVEDDNADYEVYTTFSDEFDITGAHIYEKNDFDHDADLSINFRGVGNSKPGGDSNDYLHGTKALDSGFGYTWYDIKSDPATAVMVLHAEGGQFALVGGYLKPYSSFGDETSVGGELESDTPTRFNNRIGKSLGDKISKVQNSKDTDPTTPIKDPLDISNNSSLYFPDLLGRIYVEDDPQGDPQLNALGNSEGYDLFTEYLFYLYDDQGPAWDSGGPEGALAGTFIEQKSFDDFLSDNGASPGSDSDSDGISDYIEYVTGYDPTNAGDFPFLDSYNLSDDQGNTTKAITLTVSKKALNFGINIYEVRPNGVESIVWSFDRGRGLESTSVYEIQENEFTFSITVVSNGSPLEISDMRVEFN